MKEEKEKSPKIVGKKRKKHYAPNSPIPPLTMFLTQLLHPSPPHPPRAGQARVRKITYAPMI